MNPSYLFDVVHIPTGISVVITADSFKEIYDMVIETFGVGSENEVVVTIRSKQVCLQDQVEAA